MKHNLGGLTENETQQSGHARRTWFRVGPGLLLAVMASAFVWIRMPHQPERTSGIPLQTPPEQASSSGTRAPEPEWILMNANSLRLTPSQTEMMRWLNGRWQEDTRDLRAGLNAASAEFEAAMKANGQEGLPLADIQRLAFPVSNLTRQLASARRAWWEEARMHLTTTQRTSTEEA